MKEQTKSTQNQSREQKTRSLFKIAYQTILELETPLGINASGKEGRYAAFFGRDSMITGLKLLRVYQKRPDETYLRIIDKTLRTATKLQGKEINYLSGEKPGKIVHEYREEGYYHLTDETQPWYVYPDKTLRNYDSTDSTPLFLILAAEYFNLIKDMDFLENILDPVEKAFSWAEKYGHKGGARIFLEYQLHRPKFIGGLVNQGWMDSKDSLLLFGKPPKEAVALVEHQGYYFKALRLWSEIYKKIDKEKAKKYKNRADKLKSEFNRLFLMKDGDLFYFSYATIAQKAHLIEIRSNPGHCLWSSIKVGDKYESIINNQYIEDVVHRLLKEDLFVPNAGIRTLSTKSKFFDPNSYHNGSIWPFDNGLIAEGFENFGFKKEAEQVKQAVLNAVTKFGTAIELYCADGKGGLKQYKEENGHSGSQKQAWTAATILDFTT